MSKEDKKNFGGSEVGKSMFDESMPGGGNEAFRRVTNN